MKKFAVLFFLSLLLAPASHPETAEAGVLIDSSSVRVNARTPRAKTRSVAESTRAQARTQPNLDVSKNEFDGRIAKIDKQYQRYYKKLEQYERKQAQKQKRLNQKIERERQRELEQRRREYEVYARKHKNKAVIASGEKKSSGFASIFPTRKDVKSPAKDPALEVAKTGDIPATGATPKKKLSFWQHMWRALFGT